MPPRLLPGGRRDTATASFFVTPETMTGPDTPPTDPTDPNHRATPPDVERRVDGDWQPGEPRERRRDTWQEFRRAYPGILAVGMVAVLLFIGLDIWMLARRERYDAEIERLRSGMTAAQRERADVAIEANENKLKVMLELIRRQARLDEKIHLAVSVDSGVVLLEREGAILRVMQAEVGPERWVGTPPDTLLLATPRGKRTIERILGEDASWEVPAWVYRDRTLPVPGDRSVEGALGDVAVILDGGTVIYTRPSAGPLADSAYVMPGSVRVRAEDLTAILPNISPGTAVYFY